MVVTRAKIVEVVGVVLRYCVNPRLEYIEVVDDIYTFLKEIMGYRLYFKVDYSKPNLYSYIDTN